MRKKYDSSKGSRNPHAKPLKKPVTIRLDEETIAYSEALAEQTALPYQTLINLYLRDCPATRRKPAVSWPTSRTGAAKSAHAPDGAAAIRYLGTKTTRPALARSDDLAAAPQVMRAH